MTRENGFVKIKYAVLLFLTCMLIISMPNTHYAKQPTPSADSIDLTGMNPYWQSEIPFPGGDGTEAELTLYVNADKDKNGAFIFDDGQEWLLLLKTPTEEYHLLPRQYVQLGKVSCEAFTDAEDALHILITVSQGANLKIYDCIYDSETKEFKIDPIYEAKGINMLTRTE
jgi:hypothetical protein